jgi:hypothetical protein
LSIPQYWGLDPIGINKDGYIAGNATFEHDGYPYASGFVTSPDGTTIPFSASGNPLDETVAWAINRKGEIVGQYEAADGTTHGFIRKINGAVTSITANCGSATALFAINDKGVVAGGGATCEFLISPKGTETDFNIPGARTVWINSINDNSWISGSYFTEDGTQIGFVRSPDGIISTISVNGHGATTAPCINNAGSVTGSFGNHGGKSYVQIAMGATSEIKIEGAAKVYPRCINSKNVVAGSYFVNDDGKRYSEGFLWFP